MSAKHTFRCDACGGEFESEWSHEDAMAEAESVFGAGFDAQGVESSCDDCWKRYVLDEPERVEQERLRVKAMNRGEA